MEPSTARTVPRYHLEPPWAVGILSVSLVYDQKAVSENSDLVTSNTFRRLRIQFCRGRVIGTLGAPSPPPFSDTVIDAKPDNMWGGRRHDNHNILSLFFSRSHGTIRTAPASVDTTDWSLTATRRCGLFAPGPPICAADLARFECKIRHVSLHSGGSRNAPDGSRLV